MEIDAIKTSVLKGNFFVTDHAITEGFKDGISVADMLHVIQFIDVVTTYVPQRDQWIKNQVRKKQKR